MAAEYEQRRLSLPPRASGNYTYDVLGIVAEFGDWELKRHAVFSDGHREVQVRRKVRPDGPTLPPLTA